MTTWPPQHICNTRKGSLHAARLRPISIWQWDDRPLCAPIPGSEGWACERTTQGLQNERVESPSHCYIRGIFFGAARKRRGIAWAFNAPERMMPRACRPRLPRNCDHRRNESRAALRLLKVVLTCINIVNYFSSRQRRRVFSISKNRMTMVWSLLLEGEVNKPRRSANCP